MVDRQLALSEAARPWIERVSVETYASDVDAYPFIYAPDPATTLVWRRTEDGYGALRVVGPRTRAAYQSTSAPGDAALLLLPSIATHRHTNRASTGCGQLDRCSAPCGAVTAVVVGHGVLSCPDAGIHGGSRTSSTQLRVDLRN